MISDPVFHRATFEAGAPPLDHHCRLRQSVEAPVVGTLFGRIGVDRSIVYTYECLLAISSAVLMWLALEGAVLGDRGEREIGRLEALFEARHVLTELRSPFNLKSLRLPLVLPGMSSIFLCVCQIWSAMSWLRNCWPGPRLIP